MGTPLEVGSAVAGAVSLALAAFEGCIRAYEFIQTVRNMGPDGDAILSQLFWEKERLLRWGDRVRIWGSPSQEALNWQLANELLQQQKELLTSAERLKKKYGLVVQEDQVELSQIDSDNEKSTLEKLFGRIRPSTSQIQSLNRQTTTKTMTSLRWAAAGKKQALRAMKDIETINNRLDDLLDKDDLNWLLRAHEALLRDLVEQSHPDELRTVRSLLEPQECKNNDRIATIAAAADLRQVIATIGDNTTQRSRPKIKVKTIPFSKLRPSPKEKLNYAGIEIARYKKQEILIEWRLVDEDDVQALLPLMGDLASVLSRTNTSRFPVLPFRGLVIDGDNLFALVFDLRALSMRYSGSLQLKSLSELIHEGHSASLNSRLRIALRLAEAVLHLHTAGWLHKGIRSNNVIFLVPSEIEDEDCLAEKDFYLVGFEHARPDTEQAKSLTRLPTHSISADLYRHPDSRGENRTAFRKSYDLYALGCVILELGLWKNIVDAHFHSEDLRQKVQRAEEHDEEIELPSLIGFGSRPKEMTTIKHAAGEKFAEAVRYCFNAETKQDMEDGGASSSLQVHHDIVEALRLCCF